MATPPQQPITDPLGRQLTRACPVCGTQVAIDAPFCPNCGSALRSGRGPTGPVIIAGLLAIAVGVLLALLLTNDDNNDNGTSVTTPSTVTTLSVPTTTTPAIVPTTTAPTVTTQATIPTAPTTTTFPAAPPPPPPPPNSSTRGGTTTSSSSIPAGATSITSQ